MLTWSNNDYYTKEIWKRDQAGAWTCALIKLPEGTFIDWTGIVPSKYAQINSSGVIAATGSTNSVSGRHALLLIPVDLAVDADRNGMVEFNKDTTSSEKPFGSGSIIVRRPPKITK